MKIIGLTGGIGSGKSTILHYIATLGYPVYSADEAGKKVMRYPEVKASVVQLLGNDVCVDGVLDRKKISRLVFNDPLLLKGLNAIIHPAVQTDFEAFVQEHQQAKFVVKESAILFESGAYLACDYTLLVTAPEALRIQRVMQRDGVSEVEVKSRINNQWTEEQKRKKADFVVENIHLKEAFKQISELLSKI